MLPLKLEPPPLKLNVSLSPESDTTVTLIGGIALAHRAEL